MSVNYIQERLAKVYVEEIVRLYGVPISITSNYDSRFTVAFWRGLQKAIGTQTQFSMAYHSQTNRQLERTIQILKDC